MSSRSENEPQNQHEAVSKHCPRCRNLSTKHGILPKIFPILLFASIINQFESEPNSQCDSTVLTGRRQWTKILHCKFSNLMKIEQQNRGNRTIRWRLVEGILALARIAAQNDHSWTSRSDSVISALRLIEASPELHEPNGAEHPFPFPAKRWRPQQHERCRFRALFDSPRSFSR